MHVEICDVSCVLVKTVKTQKQIKYKKKKKCSLVLSYLLRERSIVNAPAQYID